MKIAFIHQWGKGGAVVWSSKITEYLKSQGHNLTVFTKEFTDEPVHPIHADTHCEVPSLELNRLAKVSPPGVSVLLNDIDRYYFYRKVKTQLAKKDFDCIIVTENMMFGKCLSDVEATTIFKLSGMPYSLAYDTLSPFSSSYNLLNSFDCVVATGNVPAQIEPKLNVPLWTVNPGVDPNMFSPRKNQSEGPVSILYVGRFGPVKNVSDLVSAVSEVHEDHPEVELVLVGDGPEKESLSNQIDDLNLSDSVRLPGYVPHNRLPEYYRNADIFVLPSQVESFGIVLLEAMSAGIPIVTTAVGQAPELISNGDNGFLFEIGNQSEIANSLAYLIDHPERRERMGTNARETVKEGYTWQLSGEKINRVIQSIASK